MNLQTNDYLARSDNVDLQKDFTINLRNPWTGTRILDQCAIYRAGILVNFVLNFPIFGCHDIGVWSSMQLLNLLSTQIPYLTEQPDSYLMCN